MKMKVLIVTLVSLLLAGCGSSSKGPAKIVSPPVSPPPSGGTTPPAPRPPGFGTGNNNGKLSIEVEEGGVVTTSPNVGSCGGPAVCDFTTARGTTVTLTAAPNSGWMFEEWDNCPGPSGLQCVIVVDALSYVKAEFDPN